MDNSGHKLRFIRLGIDTLGEFIVYLHSDCSINKLEGFEPEAPVLVIGNNRSLIANLNIVQSNLLKIDEVSLSESAWQHLGVGEGDYLELSHPEPITSLKYVRAKIFGKQLNAPEFDNIVFDIVSGKYSKIHLASFITAFAHNNLTINEILYLTQSLIKTGKQLHWDAPCIMDKHSVGGIPGNRITPIIVAIVAAAGLMIPKTSSRAITSPAGTADVIETVTPINLTASQIQRVVNKEGGCMVWGNALGFSPADDRLLHVERTLRIDPIGQMIASILSKKSGIGATHVVIDVPVGPTAKIRSDETFNQFKNSFIAVAKVLGLNTYLLKTDGTQPIGRGIGPALEMKDILAILNNEQAIQHDLKNKAIEFAAILLEAGNKATSGNGTNLAKELLETGRALKKFIAICEAQGGFREPPSAIYTYDIVANHEGKVIEINNRHLSMVAKLAGAPHHPAAGIEFFAQQGTHIDRDQLLFRIHAESKGELNHALSYVNSVPPIIKIKHEK